MDLSNVCHYLKAIIITPEIDDFIIAAPFRHSLSNAELKKGILAYQKFLHKLYDKIAADKELFVTKKSQQYTPDAIIKTYFPIIDDILKILYALGLNGKLEIGSTNLLICDANVFDDCNFTLKRKLELLNYLFDLDVSFNGINLSSDDDIEIDIFNVEYEDHFFVIGLKLMAQAQANIKNLDLAAVMMRGDYRPLVNAIPKKQVIQISDYATSCQVDIKHWIVNLDKFLLENGCKVVAKGMKILYRGNGSFEYTSKKTKLKICHIDIRIAGAQITLYGNHFAETDNIINELPDDMLHIVKNNKGCKPCSGPMTCTMVGRYFPFTQNNQEHLCCGGGFRYELNENTDLQLLKKWIEKELDWNHSATPEEISLNSVKKENLTTHESRWLNKDAETKNKAETSVYELTNKEQRLVKPSIEGAIDYFLEDEKLKKSMNQLLEFMHHLNLEPVWRSKNKYVCRCKAMDLISFRIEGKNDFNIAISAFGWRENIADFQTFLHALPSKMKQKFVNIKAFHCRACSETCTKGVKFDHLNHDYLLCSSQTYICENPTTEQLMDIKWLVNLSIAYIEFKKQKKATKDR